MRIKMTDLATGTVCNNSCIMCTTIRGFDLNNAKQPMNSKSEIINNIQNNRYHSCFSITGGEPTLRDDLFEIIKEIKSVNPKADLRLLTNGRRLFYRKYAYDLVKSGVNIFTIPLHAHCWELHDFITRTKGSFQQTIKGLQNLGRFIEHGIQIEIRIVIHGANYPFVPETADLINKHFPFANVVMFYYDSIGSAHINREKLMVDISKTVPYIEKACDILKQPKQIYHIPHCMLNQDYRKYSAGQTVEDIRIAYTDKCKLCVEKENCSKLWRTYFHHKGDDEIKTIK